MAARIPTRSDSRPPTPRHVDEQSPAVPVAGSPADRAFFTGLVDLVPELRARAFRLTGNAAMAEDVVQDALERALRFSDRYEPGTRLRAWALQIVFNVFVTHWRRGRRERRAFEALGRDPMAWTTPEPFTSPDAAEGALLPSTRRALEALPEPFRNVVVLVDLGEHSYRDAAQQLGVPVGTVMSRLHRARRLLAAEMQDERCAA